MKQFNKRPLKSYDGLWGAVRGTPRRDLAARVNWRLTEFIDHFNQFVVEVHTVFEQHNIAYDELDEKVTAMRETLEGLQDEGAQNDIPNGYLEQMFVRIYEDLARLIDERFAQYGYTQPPPTTICA